MVLGIAMSFQSVNQQGQSGAGEAARQAANRETQPSAKTEAVSLTKADAFLQIFCEPAPGAADSPQQADAPGDAGAPSGRLGRFSRLRKLSAFIHELRAALRHDAPPRRWGIAVALAMSLMIIASAYLMRASSAQDAQRLADEALAKAVVPEWSKLLDNGQFEQAAASVAEDLQGSESRPDGDKLLNLLQWIGDLQQFAVERGGLDRPFVLFQDEKPVQDLLDRWDADVAGNQVMLVRISNDVETFEPIRVRVSSQLRELQSTFQVYLQASNALRAELAALLHAGKADAAKDRLSQFQEAYPHVSGAAALADDIARFAELRQAVAAHDLQRASGFYDTRYQTALVADAAAAWMAEHAPPKAALARFDEALAAWKRGKSEDAVALLQEMQGETWGDMAKARIDRFRQISQTFSALAASQNREDYPQRLLSFYQTLQPSEDQHFIEAIEFQAHIFRQVVMDEAEQRFQQVAAHWRAYQQTGGLTGLLRLEKSVSTAFRQRAELLKSAFVEVSRAADLYSQAASNLPAERQALHDEVLAEAMRQRQWLRDLGLVLDPTLLQAKLELLPELMEKGN